MIAIDPGCYESAYVILSGGAVHAGKVKNDILIARLPQYRNEILAIEMIQSYGMSVGREVFETAYWTGRFVQAHGGKHRKIYRTTIKGHLCHDARATDKDIRAAIIARYGQPGTKKAPGKLYGLKNDMWSALAVALTALETPDLQEAKTTGMLRT